MRGETSGGRKVGDQAQEIMCFLDLIISPVTPSRARNFSKMNPKFSEIQENSLFPTTLRKIESIEKQIKGCS